MVKVIYPTLVEQSYQFMKNQGTEVSKDEIYKELVKNGTINDRGEPTKAAIKKGLVTVKNYEHKTLKEFKKEFSVFKKYSNEKFVQFDNVWYISPDILDDLQERINKLKLSTDEINDVVTYYGFRNYEEPRTIGEFKGTLYPEFFDVPDDYFVELDGKLHLSVEGLIDNCKKVINGETCGNIEKAHEILANLSES